MGGTASAATSFAVASAGGLLASYSCSDGATCWKSTVAVAFAAIAVTAAGIS